MMSILRKILEAIEASRSIAGLAVNEEPGHLQISGKMTHAALIAWQAVFDDKCAWLKFDCKDEAHDSIEPRNALQGENQRLSIIFESPVNTSHLFTPEGWRIFLYNEQVMSTVRIVKLAFINSRFETRAFSVEPWIGTPSSVEPQYRNCISDNGPRRQVRCQSPDLMAPARIEPWILSSSVPDNCKAIIVWNKIAAEMIAKSLPNELYKENNVSKVCLIGQPPRRIKLGEFNNYDIPIKLLQEAASWLYLEGDDVEVRHTFLTAELARAWTLNVSFCDGLNSRLAGALDSARLVYKAHLRSGSKDIIKALADLRKTLSDEVQKLLQQSRDLSASVWRDVAIAIGILAIRLAMDSVKAGGMTLGFAAIYFLVAVYIIASYRISISTNNKFLDIVETARVSWRTKLYAFLDDDDYQILADKPLTDAVKAYRTTQTRTTVVVVTVVLLLCFGIAVESQWLDMGLVIQGIKDKCSAIFDWIIKLPSLKK